MTQNLNLARVHAVMDELLYTEGDLVAESLMRNYKPGGVDKRAQEIAALWSPNGAGSAVAS
ncbi:MAG: hypothetical protein ABI591_09685 [Kofleriaceae bacterium]